MLRWLAKKFKSTPKIIRDVPLISYDATAEAIHNVRKAFKEQDQQMKALSLRAHDPTCEDVLTCKKNPCFIWIPDKIVSGSKEVRVTEKQKATWNRMRKKYSKTT